MNSLYVSISHWLLFTPPFDALHTSDGPDLTLAISRIQIQLLRALVDNRMSIQTSYSLTPEQKGDFLKYGYVHLTGCFSREKAASWTDDMWTRLSYSPEDKSTWTSRRVSVPSKRSEPIRTFAPKAWAAICELLGGESRVSDESAVWSDDLAVDLGIEELTSKPPHPSELLDWHVDGDSFVHFLDSPERSLLVIPLLSDVQKHGGGTAMCSDAISSIAQHLYDHPEGVMPDMAPRSQSSQQKFSFCNSVVKGCDEFHEISGTVGDVFLLHPLMCLSTSANRLGVPGITICSWVSLKEPFDFDRKDAGHYSLVERKTLQALGKDRLRQWKIATKREALLPDRLKIRQEMKELEFQQLREALERYENTNGICCLRGSS